MDENADGGVVTAVATENASSVTVDDERFVVADGNLKLAAGTMLDFETDTSPIEVTITASGDGESATHTVSVSINDVNEAPTISVADGTTPDGMEAVSTVEENVTGALLGAITLSDVDAGQMHTLSTSDEKFVTKQDDEGGWWLALADDASLSYEDGAEVTVTVTVTDDGDPAMSASVDVTITVTDVNEAPTIEVADGETPDGMPASSTVDENNAGAILGAITLSDPDEGQMHTLEVTGDDRVVAKQDDEGGWWLALADGESFDFEADGDSIDVTVMVTDSGDPAMSASADVTIMVSDVNEAAEVDEEVAVADAVFVAGQENSMEVDLGALFMDPDGDTLTYSLSDNAPDWLELSVAISGSGDDQTITGTISGTPPAGDDMSVDGVSIVATDDGGLSSEAMFDVVVDAENDAPTVLQLQVTMDGTTIGTDEVDVEENDAGASIGTLVVLDPDDNRHPHGQHEFSFMSGGKADDRFEVTDDGTLRLKDETSLDYEQDSEIVLTITAMDKYVTAPGEDEDDTRESTSLDITITVKDVGAGGGPAGGPKANEIGDWWVTVDDRLDPESAREGEWLSFGLKTSGEDAAFSDEGALTYSIAVADSRGNAVSWLQIDPKTGEMTNVAGKDGDDLPDSGVYTVTVTATNEDDLSTSASFKLAVAVGDKVDGDNDSPDIRNVDDYDYTEGSATDASVRVASFEVRDDDIAIAPHPNGTLEVKFTATQNGVNVANRFKLVELGDDGDDTADYEIHHKSAAELAVNDEGEPLVDADDNPDPIDPIDFEKGDEVIFTVTATDGQGAAFKDEQTIRVDVEDSADAKPVFSHANHKTDPMTMMGTTTFEVDQQDKDVIVLQLDGRDGVWSDPDTDVDELEFDVDGQGDLPDWIKVYGPDEWEDIKDRREAVTQGDAPSGLRDRDLAIAIVIDHSAATGDERMPGEDIASFTVTATDPDGNSTTETISIDIEDINVDIPTASEDDVVTITGDPDGTGSLEMVFDQDLDPDFAAGEEPVLVLYTWSNITAGPDGILGNTDDVETAISVSTSPQPLSLLVDANNDGIPDVAGGNVTRDYAGEIVKATVQYFETNPDGTIEVVSHNAQEEVAADSTATPAAVPAVSTAEDDVTFHITTDATGLSVLIGATGQPAAAAGTVRLEVSTNGTSGWITEVGEQAADATSGVTAAAISLAVNENSDATSGDGGGLYYRVVYTYNDANGRPMEEISEVIDQLGNVTVSTGNGDPTAGNATLGNATAVGGTIRADTEGNPAKVQWQMWVDADRDTVLDANEWVDIDGETDVSLTITNDYVGSQLRAKVTYTHEDNPATTAVNENGWIRWVETTTPLAGPADPANVLPSRTEATTEIRVNITQTMDSMGAKTSVDGHGSGSVADLFFDTDGDTLTYNLAGPAGLTFQAGDTVYVSGDLDATATGDQTQTLAIDSDTGAITYYTNSVTTHDADPGDGLGNTLVVEVNANDGTGDTAAPPDPNGDVTVTVRVNVSPTAIWAGDDPAALSAADALGMAVDAMGKPTDATDLSASFADTDTDADNTDDAFAETAGVTKAQADSIGAIVSFNVQDQNSSSDPYGTHVVTVNDPRFHVTPTGGGRRDTDGDGSTWELRVKEGAVFDYEAKANPMGVVTVKVTATDAGGHSVDGYFTIQLADVGGTGGNKATDDPHYKEAPERPDPPPAEDPETPGLEDDSDDSDNDGAVPPEEDEEGPGDGGMFIDDLIGDDLLGDYVLAIDDMEIA